MQKSRGVILVMYDMPVENTDDRRCYTKFRKFLLRNGYIAMQKSVYVKLLRSIARTNLEVAAVCSAAPSSGTINILPLTINSFNDLVSLGEQSFDMQFFSDDVIVV